MKPHQHPRPARAIASLAAALLLAPGCQRDGSDARIPENPRAAASQLEGAFASAHGPVQAAAKAAADALRAGDASGAVDSLHAIKASEAVTAEQGLAIHGSLVALEASLIGAMESGDPKARQAYQRLKALKGK